MVTVQQLQDTLNLVRGACKEFVQLKYFQHSVLTRFEQWINGLPRDRDALATEIARMAEKQQSGTGADVNGVALDEEEKPSLESMVLYYSTQERGLFPLNAVHAIQKKLMVHNGPRYAGTWP
jgi:hypothetical protein